MMRRGVKCGLLLMLLVGTAGVRPARVQRRAAAARDEVADPVVLGALVDVVVPREHRRDLVLLEQRRPALAQVARAAEIGRAHV